MHTAAVITQQHNFPAKGETPCNTLSHRTRILYLPHLTIYDIYKPMAHLQDQRCSVSASEPENKRTYTLYKGSLEECQRFLAALASTINTATEPAVDD